MFRSFFTTIFRGSSAVLCAVTILPADLRSLSLYCYTVCGRMCMLSVRVWCSCPLVICLLYREFAKSLCTYKMCWKWCPRASIQASPRLILFANTFCRSACEMFLMYVGIAGFNSLSARGWSRYTAALCIATFWTLCSISLYLSGNQTVTCTVRKDGRIIHGQWYCSTEHCCVP
jgi:hypothetical protein